MRSCASGRGPTAKSRMPETVSPIHYQDLGVVPYREALALQEKLREERIAEAIGDRLLLLEHPKVFTEGRRDSSGDFLSSEAVIRAEGIDIVKVNRGGRITYHGPGQLVAYFIMGLDSVGLGVKEFVRAIEEICLGVLADCGVEGQRDEAHPGIWVGRDKITAIGLNIAHGVTQHGLAMNVDLDLAPYQHILACGIRDRGVTSIARVASEVASMDRAKGLLIAHVGRILGREMVEEI